MPLPARTSTPLSDVERQRLAWRAASIHERMSAGSGARVEPNGEGLAEADALFTTWKQTFAHGDAAALDRRIGWEGWTTDNVRAVLADRDSGATDSTWTTWIDSILAELPAAAELLADRSMSDALASEWAEEPPFIELWVPVERAATAALAAAAGPGVWAGWTAAAEQRLRHQLVRELAIWVAPAMLDAFQAFSVEDSGEGTTAGDDDVRGRPEPGGLDIGGADATDARYRAFVETMLGGGWRAFLEAYPLLARQLAKLVDSWVASTAELLRRLRADRRALAATFGVTDLGAVSAVEPALSDPHHGRRRVVALTFDSGARFVYKPRSLAIDQAFASLLEWLAARGVSPAPRSLAVLDRTDHGWVEFARHAHLSSSEDAARFYRQAGALLAVAHILRGRDLHQDNVVATWDGPVLIDLEMLFQPPRGAARTATDEDDASEARTIEDIATSTGLVSMFEAGADGAIFDVGGLAGTGTGSTSLSRRVWHSLRSSAIGTSSVTEFAAAPGNAVYVNDAQVRPSEHAADILDGFRSTYRVCLEHRAALLAGDGPLEAFRHASTRVLPRPTNQYAMLSAVLGTPRYQREGVRRSIGMDVLLRPFAQGAARPASWPVLVEERRALDALDVPYFTVPVDGTTVRSEHGALLEGYLQESGFDAVRARISGLSDSELAVQLECIERALVESPRTRFETRAPTSSSLTVGGPGHQPTASRRDDWLAAGEWIGHELRARAHESQGQLTWSTSRGGDKAPLDLYGGSTGVALFFGALAHVTGDAHWKASANAALQPILASLENTAAWDALEGRVGVGDGIGSVAYSLATIGQWLERDDAVDAAFAALDRMRGHVEADADFDVLSGSAGAILAALTLDGIRRDSGALTLADQAFEHLERSAIEHGEGPLTSSPATAAASWTSSDGRHLLGFAHGVSGVAYALARLHTRTSDPRVEALARRAFRFVRRHYRAADSNWPIAATVANENAGAQVAMTAWCHGAPGVGLAEALARNVAFDGPPFAELQGALNTTALWVPGRADHLCCGTMGRVDALLTAGRALNVAVAIHAAENLAGQVLERAQRAGHFRLSTAGFEYRVFAPGFFRGLSGIGYQFLRLAEPGRLPSVLAFQ